MRLRRRRWQPVIPIWLVVLGLVLLSSSKTVASLRPAFWALAEIEARAKTTEITARAVSSYMAQGRVMLHVEKDSQGRVTMVQPDVRLINLLATESALVIQEEMKALSSSKIEIPAGLLTGNYLLSALGPRLSLRILQVGAVTVDTLERFEAVGINQTRYVVLIKAATIVRVVAALEARDITVETTYPVAEVIFSGEVPRILGVPR